MDIIGRIAEQDALNNCLLSPRPEFVVVYGRRRVGKTFLVREYFKGRFAFYATGLANEGVRNQLRAFGESLRDYGDREPGVPKDWFEAFSRLKALLASDCVYRDPIGGKLVVFLDELPWFDTPRSHFRSALEHFWNSWASAQKDMLLIVCGSATSWITTNLLKDKGGFHNRVTRQIRLEPFTLKECDDYYASNGVRFSRRQAIESYMVFGGVPYYLNLIDKRLSLAQNIDQLCFAETGQLRYEFDRLYASLFKNARMHTAIIRAMAKRKAGVTRSDLEKTKGIGGGQPLTSALDELEQCGFIRKYRDYGKAKYGHVYQLVDPFTLFYLRFLDAQGDAEFSSWMTYLNSPSYRAWSGNAFEMVCLAHVRHIKDALGIAGVESRECSWRSRGQGAGARTETGAGAETSAKVGAQIDLLIDRRDGVINVCEMKFFEGEFAIDAAYERALLNKLDVFEREAHPRKALHLTMVAPYGIAHNGHDDIVQRVLTADDLFRA